MPRAVYIICCALWIAACTPAGNAVTPTAPLSTSVPVTVTPAPSPGKPATDVPAVASADGVQDETYSVPLGDLTSAKIMVDAPFQEVYIRPLPQESDQLFVARVQTIGKVTFTARGSSIILRESAQPAAYTGEKVLRWYVEIHPDAALDLEIQADAAQVKLDAAGLALDSLKLQLNRGEINAHLAQRPASVVAAVQSGALIINIPSAAVTIDSLSVGSGQAALYIADGAQLQLVAANIGSGMVHIDAPDDAAVRLEIHEVAAGMVNLAYPLTRLSGDSSDTGIWETQGYSIAPEQTVLVIDYIGAGTLELE